MLEKLLYSAVVRMSEWSQYSWVPGKEGETVLDVGCGVGSFFGIFC